MPWGSTDALGYATRTCEAIAGTEINCLYFGTDTNTHLMIGEGEYFEIELPDGSVTKWSETTMTDYQHGTYGYCPELYQGFTVYDGTTYIASNSPAQVYDDPSLPYSPGSPGP